MGSRKSCAGSSVPAVLLSIVILILVGSTLYFHIAKTWWFPAAITPVGHQIDQQFFVTFILTGIVFVLAQLALAWMVFRYRDRGQKAHFVRGNHMLEVVWTTATLVIFVGLGVMAAHAWGEVHFGGPQPGALQVEVTGVQFVWNFRYPGPDGKFGRINPKDIDASVGNPLGLDPNDLAGKDDIVTGDLYLPVGREIELMLRSQDVIHSFFVRELRVKQDTVPGLVIPVHFTVTKIGNYEITCNQLCGLGHYHMHAMLHVLSAADFQQWEQKQETQNAQAGQ
ncbi:MAG: cytochrome c oxidase subunit II [Candidatus Acidiferrales bacterium]